MLVLLKYFKGKYVLYKKLVLLANCYKKSSEGLEGVAWDTWIYTCRYFVLLHWQNTDLLRFFQGNFWVTAANLGFSFLSMFHLAYLGIMFGGDTEVQEKVTFCLILRNIILDGLNYPPLPAQQVWLSTNLGQPILFNSLRVKGCILIIFNEVTTYSK